MANRYDLAGRSAIVTGAAKGIGRAVAQALLAGGAQVTAWDRMPAELPGGVAKTVDVTQPEQIAAALAGTSRIDILVNAAGHLGRTVEFADHRSSDWRQIVDVNLIGTLQVTQAVLPVMLRLSGGGRIVNFGSLAGKEGLATLAAYSAASGGVIAFTKALSRELAGRGILVNCVAPGPIDTDMIRDLGPEAVERMIADSPMKRLGTAAEVAELVAWLCSDAGRFNAGAVFDMSGGRARY